MAKETDVKLLRDGVRRQLDTPAVRDVLRDKQVEALQALISPNLTDEQISHSYYKLPTGFGKTVMFAHMARAYFDATDASGVKRQKIIIVVPTLGLIGQTQEKLAGFAGITATEFSGRKKDTKSDVIITTYDSFANLGGMGIFEDVGFVFADEAHHMLGDKIARILKYYNKYIPIIGFTATPDYGTKDLETNHAVSKLLNTEIYAMSIPEAVSSGVLCPVKNVLYRSSIVCDLSSIEAKSTGEYDWSKIKISPNKLASEIARIYAQGVDENTGIEFKNLRAIINCPNTTIADIQAAKINEVMGRDVAIALHTSGISNKEYKDLQAKFVSGKYSVACQVNTLTEGFDDVTVSMCINYPTRSRVRAEQAAGRAIRIDEKNPDKIAFVVDTIFRATADEKPEDILYTASNSKQVLFKDIAGGMVLYPENFRARVSRTGNRNPRNNGNVRFVDFDLITDTAVLVDLNAKTDKRIADENIPEKTDEWQSANDLAKDNTFPMGNRTNIANALKIFQNNKKEWIQMRQPARGQAVLCLHSDGREWFLKQMGIKYIPPKTEEWQSSADLMQDKTFQMGDHQSIKRALESLQTQKPEWIQMHRAVNGATTLCLHRDGRVWFLKQLGIKYIPPKTEEWQSAIDLINDKTFPIGNYWKVKKNLEEFQSEKPEWIQVRQPTNGQATVCLHRDGREWFLDKSGIKDIPPKTAEWQSIVDLRLDKTFPVGSEKDIKEAFERFQSEKPEWIQMRKNSSGRPILCLHIDGREWLLEKMGKKYIPPKTEEWQSTNELADDKTFIMRTPQTITNALEQLQVERPEWIQVRKPNNGRASICLHRDGRKWFLKRVEQEKQTKKESMRRGAAVLNAATNVIGTAETIKSSTADNTKKK